MSPTKDDILRALCSVFDTVSGKDVVTLGLISGVTIANGKAGFLITIDPKDKEHFVDLRERCEAAVRNLTGIESVTAVLTAHHDQPLPPSGGYTQPRERAQWNLTPLEHVVRIIAVASGKGGVGKSTTTVNLAHALHATGKRVGLLDADIYGPSIPRMMGLQSQGQPEIKEGKMIPPIGHGIPCMSMGFITGNEAAILRGPMISKTLQQLLRFTQWGTKQQPLDILLVDMPPGTGDIHLSMAQQVPLSGAIIVTTPQEVAIMDARKCLHMFEKVNVPILGVVENMSGDLFGSGGGKQLAVECKVPFLGEITADANIRKATDSGQIFLPNSYQILAKTLTQH